MAANLTTNMAPALANAQNYLDLGGLNSIREQSNSTDKASKDAALQTAAKQFEGIFMQMLMKSMRKAQDVLESDSPFNSESSKFYRDMHDQQLSLELSSNGSLGLAELIVRQLGGDSENFTPKSILRSDGDLAAIRAQQKIDNTSAQVSNNRHFPTTFLDPSAKSLSTPTFEQPQDFVSALTETAKTVEKKLGIPFEVVIAQAALETGWGQKIIKADDGTSSNNLFNIKADSRWAGDKVHKETLEFEQGTVVKKNEPFRVYQSIAESVNDYVEFLSSSDRYQGALENKGNVEHFLHGLQQAGYATDPNYANKILATLSKVTSLINK
ncbi:MAG: flagellar protein FlgJ [Alteromonadaceae bacterium]|jgi:flagellar protein FlgJ